MTPDFKNVNEVREYLHDLTGILWQYSHSRPGIEAFKGHPMTLATAMSVRDHIQRVYEVPMMHNQVPNGIDFYTWDLQDTDAACVISMFPGTADADGLHEVALRVYHEAWVKDGDDDES